MVQPSSQDKPEILIIAKAAKTSKSEISRVMAEMGRQGGLIGGKRRLETMSVGQRKSIAKKAAKARWEKAKKQH